MPLLNEKILGEIICASQSKLEQNETEKNKKSNSSIAIPINLLDTTKLVTKKSLVDRIPAFGIICALLSVICFSLASLIVKILTDLHAIEILVIRSIIQIIFYGSSIAYNKYPILGEKGHRMNLALRAISGTISLSAIFIAYRLMPLSDASTIHFASPVFVTVFAYFMLKEAFTKLQLITGVITIIGVTIISKPEFLFGATESSAAHEYRILGTVLSVIAAITAAFSIIQLRKLKTTPAAVVVFWYSFSLIICGLIILVILDKLVIPSGVWTYALLLAIGCFGIGDQYFLTLALQHETAGAVSVTRTFNIVLSFLWEVLILSEAIEWTSIAGACIVSSCVIVLALVKWKEEKPQLFAKISLHKLKKSFICCHCNGNEYQINSLTTTHTSIASSTYTLDDNNSQNTIHSNIILIDNQNKT